MTDYLKLPTLRSDGRVHVVVESPQHSRVKFAYSPELQVFEFSREMIVGLSYPYDWGFVPSTLAEDGDPLDALIIHQGLTYPGIVISCRPIGILDVSQTEKSKTVRNDRVFFVPDDGQKDPDLKDVRELETRVRRGFEAFFVAAVENTGKKLEFLGWRGPKGAQKAINETAKKFKAQQDK